MILIVGAAVGAAVGVLGAVVLGILIVFTSVFGRSVEAVFVPMNGKHVGERLVQLDDLSDELELLVVGEGSV